MSDDELEKLAAAMKNISPSKAARKSGMEAALAAFDAEFETETVVVTETAEEKISTTNQGMADAPRPTGQTIGTGPVASLGRDAMSRVKEFFTFKPKTMMMMGTCAAALFATSLYIPNTRFEEMPKPVTEAVTAKVGASEVKAVEIGEVETGVGTDAFSEMKQLDPSVSGVPAPATDPGILSAPKRVEPTMRTPVNTETEGKTVDGTERSTIRIDNSVPTVETTKSKTADVDATARNEAITAPPSKTHSAEAVMPERPSNVVTIERRILKSPARTMERVAPAVPKVVTRRVIKTPASTVERSVPAVTKQETRRVAKGDGTFETVTETVLVQPATVEYVTIPPTYETIEETVVVQEASTELVTLPPVYETVRETVKINADGSSEVLSSDVVPSAKESAVEMASVSELALTDRTDSASVVAEAEADGLAKDTISPPSYMLAEAEADEIVVTGAKRKSRRATRRSKRAEKAAVPSFAPPPPSVLSVPLESKSAEIGKLPPGARYVERVIPAVTKTRTRRVVKTPASTQERVIPAITKDVTVQVLTEDGTYKDVTKTFVIQEARVELVTVPPVYKTITETVVVDEGMTELVAIDAEGNVIQPKNFVKPPKPKPRPQSGLLTAGDYDDVLNPDLYKVYLDKMLQGQLKGKDLPYVDASERVSIRVVDSLGKPVPLADVSLKTSRGAKMFPLRTGADGMAYLYPNYDSLESGIRVKVSAKGARSVTKRLTRKLIKNGGDIVVDLKMDSAPVQALDLLLTIDATGSMGDEMRYLQSELKAIVGRVEKANPGVDIRTGLVVYRDKGDDYVVREIPFTDDIEDFRASLAEQYANGGGDKPEAMHTALQTGLDMEWRKDALKINLLVADAPPHDRYLDETWEAGLMSRRKGIHIVPLAASGVDKTAEFVMRAMAQITGGRFLFLTDDSGIGNSHAKPTVDCYVVTRLDGLVTRVLSSLIRGERVEPEASDIIRSVGNYRAGTCAIEEQDIPSSIQTVSYKYRQ